MTMTVRAIRCLACLRRSTRHTSVIRAGQVCASATVCLFCELGAVRTVREIHGACTQHGTAAACTYEMGQGGGEGATTHAGSEPSRIQWVRCEAVAFLASEHARRSLDVPWLRRRGQDSVVRSSRLSEMNLSL